MTTWKFEDGSRLSSGGQVAGTGEAAVDMRRALAGPWLVQAAPHPMGATLLDVNSDYLLDVFARSIGFGVHQKVKTNYVFREEDVPAEVREQLREARRAYYESPIGTRF